MPPVINEQYSIREVLLCPSPLSQWGIEVHICSEKTMFTVIVRPMHVQIKADWLWSIALPFEGYPICSDQKLFKVPANVIDFDWGPIKFLYISNNWVHEW